MLRLNELDIRGKTLLVREDFNVPLNDEGMITNDERIQRALPTIQYALQQGAAVILLSHLGRPTEGQFDPQYSLAPVAKCLSDYLKQDVRLVDDWQSGITLRAGEVALCENCRFAVGEKKNDPQLAKQFADLCDIFVMDAFAVAHRAQASTVGAISYAKQACAGPLLCAEIDAIEKILAEPERPLLAIVGGAKVSSKLNVLQSILGIADSLIVGGGIANTFLATTDVHLGKSLYEPDLVQTAQDLLVTAKEQGVHIPLPKDVVVAKTFSADATPTIKMANELDADDMILDVGPQTIADYQALVKQAKTILWNGPLGVFEFDAFAEGTAKLTQAIAASQAFSVAGGGDTIAALAKYDCRDKISYVSTGGGAFLEFIEHKTLPAIEALN